MRGSGGREREKSGEEDGRIRAGGGDLGGGRKKDRELIRKERAGEGPDKSFALQHLIFPPPHCCVLNI